MSLPTSKSLNKDIQHFLKNMGVAYSYPSKQKLLEKVQIFRDVVEFPWRNDQKEVIDSFIEQQKKFYVVNGIFGCGKTTMLLGIHVLSIIKGIYKPSDAMFISFNICIRNELKQRLKGFGMSRFTKVRTFDSLIYEICKLYEYPYLDLPNYDGKRKFVYLKCRQILHGEETLIELSVSPKFIFIDECQDLETQTMLVFRTFFCNSQVIFTGDVFQSIQKEPKESLLWNLLHDDTVLDISRHHMRETPRVPINVLNHVKHSLQKYYPEFKDEIEKWKSSNTQTLAVIEWKKFNHYKDIFSEIDLFLSMHPPEESMILTFSSAITVKGAMGDLARIRRYLIEKNIDVNKNHKKLDYGKLFLSTANSSKGLERNNVLLISTFPLERAFINFSNDLVMNLITVGITRAKKRVLFMVPVYIDKYSVSLNNFTDCPKPTKERIRDDKVLQEYTFTDYYNMEHCVTEIIKQNMVKYDTRIQLQKYVKQFDTSKLFPNNIPVPKIDTDEERAFVGVLIENLITSSWIGEWPKIDDIEKFRNHPMYFHCFKRIERLVNTYKTYTSQNTYSEKHFDGIYIYSQIHLGIFNKIFMDLNKTTQEKLHIYWTKLKPEVIGIKPEGSIKIQVNMKMPFATGICDVLIADNITTIWELKASTEYEWKENALFQAMLYALMTGKTRCKLVLLNPFRNEKCSYNFNMKSIMKLRENIIDNLLNWNINCFMAKNIKSKGIPLKVTDNYLLYMKEYPDNPEYYQQIVLIYFVSPSKFDIIFNIYTHNDKFTKSKRSSLSRIEKLCLESDIDEQTALTEVFNYLHGSQCIDSKIYYAGDCNIDDSRFIRLQELITDPLSSILKCDSDDIINSSDIFTQTMLCISSLANNYKLV